MKFRSYVGEEKKENGRNNAGEWKRATNKRQGVTIFVEFVSKRIHRAALMEAFSEYGRVLDVYMAYYNKKRYSRKYTFAFVRFARWEDAARAVVRGNNRRMDGFHVKVYFDKKYQESCGKDMVSSCRSQQELASTIKYNSKVVKGRSFKDALLGITIPEETGGLPMAVWHATVIESIASKWGRVISIDADTLERNKFDYARVLLGVSSITDVPKDATVVLNGDKFFIRMSSSKFEDNRCWINGGSSVDSMDEEDRCRFEDLPREFNEVEAEVSLVNGNIETDPKKLCTVGSPWTMENSGGTKLKDSKPQEVLETNEPKAVDHWNDVPIVDGSDLSVPSSGFSESMGPVVDNETGLFTIKPRVLKNTQMISPCLLRPKEVKTKSQKALSYIALTQSGSKVIRALQNYSSPKSTTIKVNASVSEGVAVKEDELEIEAAKCLEVCNVSELYFKATNEEVRRRFKIMGKRDRSHR
ncbi:hypothetical protein V6N12_051134 [Hibiscus sabdariffa]|uniref:RRM domain-containing protein n=1 Tax=Hibiscus sabdariffa TaxID=183260 RepID=A0ABR2GEG6_9ROSI